MLPLNCRGHLPRRTCLVRTPTVQQSAGRRASIASLLGVLRWLEVEGKQSLQASYHM